MTRDEARAAGLARYDAEGVPCRHGHTRGRYVSSGQCAECLRLKVRRMRSRLPPKVLNCPRIMARAAGSRTYLGKSCKGGHRGERYVRSALCVDCPSARGGRRLSGNDPIASEAERQKRRAKAKKYRERKRLGGRHTEADVRWLMVRQGGKCAICLLKIGKSAWEADHRIALVCGGTNDRANMQVSHMKCNRSKGKRDEIEYAQATFGRLL